VTPALLVTVSDQGEADVVCSFLRVEGIACSTRSVRGADESATTGEGFHGGGPCEIYVDERHLEWAHELVTAMRSDEDRGRL
jgi:hypothetical protein